LTGGRKEIEGERSGGQKGGLRHQGVGSRENEKDWGFWGELEKWKGLLPKKIWEHTTKGRKRSRGGKGCFEKKGIGGPGKK